VFYKKEKTDLLSFFFRKIPLEIQTEPRELRDPARIPKQNFKHRNSTQHVILL